MRVVIVGLGGVGAMAAWRLALEGHDVIGVEQFAVNHDQGSSYGDSRIVRRVYADPLYTALMQDAYALWDELNAHAPDAPFFARAGGVFCGPGEHPQVIAAARSLEGSGVAFEVWDAAQCARRFPAFRLRPEEIALYEPSMGYARASRAVMTAVSLASAQGADIRANTRVLGLETRPQGLRVRLARNEASAPKANAAPPSETLDADSVLIAAGAWNGPLLASLGVSIPLTVTRQPYVHLRPLRDVFRVGAFPVWIDAAANTYGFPQLGDVPGVKIGLHDFGPATTPETVDRDVQEADRDTIRRCAAARFPDLSREVVYEKVCLYANTPDEDFVMDAVPNLPGAFVVSACSGHGFKFTPLLGQIAARLVTGQPVPYDLSRFRLARFAEAGLL